MSTMHVHHRRVKPAPGRRRFAGTIRREAEDGFICLHCRGYVYLDPGLSTVHHRNHCPYCLWSRHLDLFAAGDRLAACKAGMRPIGLTFKQSLKRYGIGRGELMLVHLCVECGSVSINRIAADDDPETVLGIFEGSLEMDRGMKIHLSEESVVPLGHEDGDAVRRQLFGWRDSLETFPGERLEICFSADR